MTMPTIDKREMIQGRFGDVVPTNQVVGTQPMVSLARVDTNDQRARSWRVTFNRVNRNDRSALLAPNDAGGSSPIWVAQDFQFTAGFQNTPQVPPRRSNPIFDTVSPGNASDVEPIWAQIKFGMSQGAPNYLLAEWPMQGASIVVEGSFVEVFGGIAVFDLGTPALNLGSFPTLSAQIAPVDGLSGEDVGELSIQQQINVNATAGTLGVFMDGVAHPTSGLTAPISPPQAAMPASSVYNTAPFNGYDAVLQSINPFNKSPRVVFFLDNSLDQFELRDNQVPTGISLGVVQWQPSQGNVGVAYCAIDGTTAKTKAQMDTLLNTSTIVKVSTAATNPTHKIVTGYTKVGAYTPTSLAGGLATSAAMTQPTQGGAVYVPDFARRVRVQIVALQATFAGLEYRVPFTGPPTCQLVWYDDSGLVVDVGYQSTSVPVEWHPVPSRAVMLGVYGDPAQNQTALIHWRIAP